MPQWRVYFLTPRPPLVLTERKANEQSETESVSNERSNERPQISSAVHRHTHTHKTCGSKEREKPARSLLWLRGSFRKCPIHLNDVVHKLSTVGFLNGGFCFLLLLIFDQCISLRARTNARDHQSQWGAQREVRYQCGNRGKRKR